jgi:hypothetical protein
MTTKVLMLPSTRVAHAQPTPGVEEDVKSLIAGILTLGAAGPRVNRIVSGPAIWKPAGPYWPVQR